MEPTGRAVANAIAGMVILVDYGLISNCNYSRTVAEIVPSVGYYLAQIITTFALDQSKLDIIGHGLGNTIAVFIAIDDRF